MKPVYAQRFEDLQRAARMGDGTAWRCVEAVRNRRALMQEWIDRALQVLLVLCTVPGMWLAGGTGPGVKWGFVILLASQPLWLIATWRARQFGMFALAFIYMGIWIRAVFNNF